MFKNMFAALAIILASDVGTTVDRHYFGLGDFLMRVNVSSHDH